MRPLTAKKVIAILIKNGFILSRQKGSHRVYRNPFSGNIVPVPLHGGNKPLPIGTFLAIVKQSKLPRGKFK